MKLKLLIVLGIFFCQQLHAQEQQSIQPILYAKIAKKGIEEAIRHYDKLKKNPEKYNLSETELNALGYRLIGERKLSEAVKVFQLNAKAYPNSGNTHDSLGEAYLRSGEHEKAKRHYTKALEIHEKSGLTDQRTTALIKNARAKLNYLNDESEYKQSTAHIDFVANNKEFPYGRLHPQAPAETEHWGRLAGEWDCTLDFYSNNTWLKNVGRAKWIWKYTLDGFAVQDLWFQRWIDAPPAAAVQNRDFAGINFRMYLPAENRWEAVWFTNNGNTTSRFDATSSEEKVVMTGTTPTGLSRITFFDITDTTFEWKSETSTDGGETWQETTRIHGKRVK